MNDIAMPSSMPDLYTTLKTAIVNLEYLPSTKLSENEVASKYNISRTPVKAAFTRLEHEGFVTVLPQRGTFVSLLNIENIKETLYMRYVLEKEVAHTYIPNVKKAELLGLKNILKEQNELVKKDTFMADQFYKLDSDFHGFMFEKSGHRVLWEELLKLQVHYTRFRMLDIVSTQKFDILIKEHSELYAAIENKDALRYTDLLEKHLHGNFKKLETSIKSNLKNYFIGGNV